MSDNGILIVTMIMQAIVTTVVWLAAWILIGHVPSMGDSVLIGVVCGIMTSVVVFAIGKRVR